MIELKPDANSPRVIVHVNLEYTHQNGIKRLIRALLVAQRWLEKEKKEPIK